MRILCGGGAGFIGCELVPTLLKLGHDVKVIDLLWFGNYLSEQVSVVKKDLFDCTEEDFQEIDVFIFLAGLSNDPMAEYSPAKNFISNGALPVFLAYLCKKAGVKRFIYASSASVYGFTDKISTEMDKINNDYPYGISKHLGEQVLQLQDDSFSVVVLRQGTVCGVSPRMRFDLIINTMFKTALNEGKIIVNNPHIWRPIYDLRDCVKGYEKVLKSNASGVFNIGAENLTVLQIAEKIKETLLQEIDLEIQLEIKNIPDKRNYRVSFDKAKDELGFEAKYTVKDTVKDLINNRTKTGDMNQDKYYNINTFKTLWH
jgi:nucleoside-diphosphate-sugar epimerase